MKEKERERERAGGEKSFIEGHIKNLIKIQMRLPC